MLPTFHPNVSPKLEVLLLGSPILRYKGAQLSITRRQVRTMLYHLATILQPIARNSLCFLFWSEHSETAARRNLSHVLTHLRKELPDPDILQTDQDLVWLDSDKVWSDVHLFIQLMKNGTGDELIPNLENGVQLYRGRYLSGVDLSDLGEFATLCEQEGTHFEHLYLTSLITLMHHYAQEKNYGRAIHYANLYLQVDEYAEDIHLLMVKMYAQNGFRGAAMEHFQRSTRILERELGIPPTPNIKAQYREFIEKTESIWPFSDSHGMDCMEDFCNLPRLDPGNALVYLRDRYHKAQSGHGGVVFICGETGIGKTTLVHNFLEELPTNIRTLTSNCYPLTQGESCYPLKKSLIESRLQLPGTLIDPLMMIGNPEEYASMRWLPMHILETEDTFNYATYFAQDPDLLRSIFEDVSKSGLILVVEDIHWADETTLNLLVELVDQPYPLQLLIFVTACCNVDPKVGKFHRQTGATGHLLGEFVLTGMQKGEIHYKLNQQFGAFHGLEKTTNRLYACTGGNPLYVNMLLEGLKENRLTPLHIAASPNIFLPQNLQSTILTRISNLSQKARRALQAAAYLPEPFTLDQVLNTAAYSEMTAMDALDELTCRHFLTLDGIDYRFIHQLIPQIVQQHMSPTRRAVLARRAQEACVPHPQSTL